MKHLAGANWCETRVLWPEPLLCSAAPEGTRLSTGASEKAFGWFTKVNDGLRARRHGGKIPLPTLLARKDTWRSCRVVSHTLEAINDSLFLKSHFAVARVEDAAFLAVRQPLNCDKRLRKCRDNFQTTPALRNSGCQTHELLAYQ